MIRSLEDTVEVFWTRFDKPHGDTACWVWKGARISTGYGTLNVLGKTMLAHRFAHELLKGPIPDGLVIDHLCRNPLCVNPAHLEAVTEQTNILRGVGITAEHAKATHCPHGHPYDAVNTYRRSNRNGRECLICRRASVRRWWAEHGREAKRRWRDKRTEKRSAAS